MKRTIFWPLFPAFMLMIMQLQAADFRLNNEKNNITIIPSGFQGVGIRATIAQLNFSDVLTPEGTFTLLGVEGFSKRTKEGEPALPVYTKLIEVPLNAEFSYTIKRQQYRELSLNELGITHLLFPAQPPMSKSDDPDQVPFIFNKATYATDRYVGDDLISVEMVGTMRAVTLARIQVSPFLYNPVTGVLKVLEQIDIEVRFKNADIGATMELKRSKASPYFNSLFSQVENHVTSEPEKGLIAPAPATYVIVSDPMFQAALQPFVNWKCKKGFRVIEAYTNNPAVGTTTTSIKSYLQGLYNSPPTGYNAPSFVLFVGDVAQIPAWNGSAGSHVTDLRYCEYTGDNLPEVFYGRFSATNLAQLQPQIDKTLQYEQYTMPDPSFLGEVVMVAGNDASYQTWGNGQINYGTETYFNAAHNILSHTYLQPEPSGGNYSQNIRSNVSNGVAYGNYTAHCSESGWANPAFTISHIPELTNDGKYGLLVGNCCLSGKFNSTCFGEEILRAANKGAVGYIGGSNSTYWDEDYWWGVGFKTVTLHPSYNAAHRGAYDGAFHDHGEATDEWFITQGQMVVCGNYAVEESNSSKKTYYWEIYHLFGDPSLMIYYSVPPPVAVSYPSTLLIGMSSVPVNTTPYATVALSRNGALITALVADATGSANLTFDPLTQVGLMDIVITAQNRQPHIGTIDVIPAEGPYVVFSSCTVTDAPPSGNGNGQLDYDETPALNIILQNVGVETATNVTATLSSNDAYLTITDNSANYGNIGPGQSVGLPGGFTVNVANNIPDQHQVDFQLSAMDGSETWNSSFTLTANAPELAIGAMTILDNEPGCNNDGILDPGETAEIQFICLNNGHSSLTNVLAQLSISGSANPYLTLHTNTFTIGTLGVSGQILASFSATAVASTPLGTPVDLLLYLSGGVASQYSVQQTTALVIGLIPEYNMANGSITACTGLFYDSGGATAAYQSNENFTQTFYPGSTGKMIRMVFSTFNTESNYDKLHIYNGSNVSAPLIGTYSGTTSPGTVTANNVEGALTFNFISDYSVARDGWSATLSCYDVHVPPEADFIASTNSPAVNSNVTFTDISENVPTSWLWSFSPDNVTFVSGTSATSQHPEVLFTTLGQYSVSLTVTNAYGSATETKQNFISVVSCIYCTTSYSNLTDDYISQVQLNTMDNPSGSTSYSDFTAISTELLPGGTYPLRVSVTVNGNWAQHVFAWIDWNNNCNFTDTGEAVDLGNAPGTSGTHLLTANIVVPAGISPGFYRIRVAERYSQDPTPCYVGSYGEAEDYTLIVPSQNRTLRLSFLLEGLYNENGIMRKAKNETGYQFPEDIADRVTIELHDAANYNNIIHSIHDVSLDTSGILEAEVPGTFSGNYYITIRHRNSVSICTAQPVTFNNPLIVYAFDTPQKAFGENMCMMADGFCAIYAGDINQDGTIDTGDMSPVDNDAANFATGYLTTDVNGDGTVDTGDMTIVDNNASGFVGAVTP
ncbi:MAG: C25 family cysteine peptidase [Lentimicrobiaceae bacterium]|nr:C25 family cysteine peptidase [Lentimicrobiaceae bacterium]